jgi:hypothetical protein
MDIQFVRNKIKKEEYDLSAHAHRERQEEQITIDEIEKNLLEGDIIEKYIKDPRGESCLVAGKILDKALHIVCGKRNNRLLIVTVYRPKKPTWIDYKTRVKEVKSRV